MQQGARDLDPAALAAGQDAHEIVHARNKVEPLELLLDPLACRAARQAVQRGVVTERLGHREVEIERRLLEDETAAGEPGVASARQVVTEQADRSLLQIEQPGDQ
jgi:hypothetical protein